MKESKVFRAIFLLLSTFLVCRAKKKEHDYQNMPYNIIDKSVLPSNPLEKDLSSPLNLYEEFHATKLIGTPSAPYNRKNSPKRRSKKKTEGMSKS